ncbi:MAG TPA: response regulator transcription factor [Stellaceae bacterium]|nr:response regulator transcription factor [Stellaceae bacterium]
MKILIVDDHPIVRAGLHRLLGVEPQWEIAEAASGQEAVAAFREESPQLVILDLNLPGISGLELLGRLRIANPKVPILVVSMYDNPVYVARVLDAGARGFVSKNAPPEQILEATRRVAAGRSYIDAETAQELALGHHRASPSLNDLSPRDLEILRLLADGGSLTEIARAIGVSYKTVANRCSQLKAKLATPRMADLIRLAVACGFGRGEPELLAVARSDGRRERGA